MRIPIIAGNWKMNNTIKEGIELIEDIKKTELDENVESVICVPYTMLKDAKAAVNETNIKIGAQNMHYEESGAFTGEISPLMLKEIGVDYVIIGHSERREYFKETDQDINRKIISALTHNIKPILCVGESLEERESNIQEKIVNDQIEKALKDVNGSELENIVIAYEPIWAIGTGKTASSDDANEMLVSIRKKIKSLYDEKSSEVIRLQYGGSVKPNNIEELMSKSDVDGALVGGASLKADDFVKLLNF